MLVLTLQIVLFAHLIWLSFYFYSRTGDRKSARAVGGGLGLLALAFVADFRL